MENENNQTVPQAGVETQSPVNKPKKPWLIIIAVILVIIVGVAAYFLLMRGNTSPITNLGEDTQKVAQKKTITDSDIQELDQDLSSIDSDLQGIDQGLNDTPENLTQ